ncbi:MAG: Smr/MutS family protein [Bacteroidia bacterium]
MGFRVGQRVMFRDSRMQGLIRSYREQTYWVEIEPGWEIPARQSELIGLGQEHASHSHAPKPEKPPQKAIEKKPDVAPEPPKSPEANPTEISWEKKPSFPKVGRARVGLGKEKPNQKDKKQSSPYPISARGVYELDLHLPALYVQGRMPKREDALKVQLEHVRVFLDWAVGRRCKEVILIHGVGEGKLKEAIWQEYEHRIWLDLEAAPYAEYGIGATRVRLRFSMRDL